MKKVENEGDMRVVFRYLKVLVMEGISRLVPEGSTRATAWKETCTFKLDKESLSHNEIQP